MTRADVEDLFFRAGSFTIKRMFGGHGVFADGLMFAIEVRGEIFLKTDSETTGLFEARGLEPFAFESKRGTMVTSYRQLPEEAHEDEGELRRWCEIALQAARRAAAPKLRRKSVAKKA